MSGFEVAVAYDGEAALAEIARSPPEAVVLDIAMPGVDGITVGALIREKCGRQIRLLALTARGDPEIQRTVAAVGFDALLQKPASLYQIVNSLRHGGARGITTEAGDAT